MTRTRKTPETDLVDVVEEFRRHLWLPDPGTVYVTLATVAANRLPGDPVWALLVGASSSGKSETTNALNRLPEYHAVSTFSEAGLVSGSSDGTPGLLIQIGEAGLLVFKDLTTILSKHKADRDGVLGCLREVYDGSYTRRLGNKGGERKWEGRLGLIAAVTEMIDDYDLGQLGERFIRYRLPAPSAEDTLATGRMVLDTLHLQRDSRAARARIVDEFFAGLTFPEVPPEPSDEDRNRLNVLAGIGARCRSPIIRDRYKGDQIERVPIPEGIGRMLAQLGQLLAGMRVIGVPEDEVWRLLAQIVLDGMHPLRRKVLDLAVDEGRQMTTATIAARCDLPSTSVRRHLEDLTALGVLEKVHYTDPESWAVSSWLKDQWWAVTGQTDDSEQDQPTEEDRQDAQAQLEHFFQPGSASTRS
jgi:hypothetical protein